jgi:uncharacterized protein YbjQ (UPF0145 family)
LSGNKKDLTSIEDLGEYIHELEREEEITEDPFGTSELPDLPANEAIDFGSTEESSFGEKTSEVSSTDFNTSDNTFENSDFLAEAIPSEEIKSQDDDSFLFKSNDENEVSPVQDSASSPQSEKELDSEYFHDPFPDNQSESENEESHPGPYKSPDSFKTPETFEEVKKFAESSSFTGMGAEGNPSFSLLIKNVRFIEDVNDILRLLKELDLMADSEELMKNRLMRGTILIPRISEYAAILLAHKLRRFDIDIQVGLSDEIHPPKHHETPDIGLVSKASLYQNQSHHFHFDDPKLEISQIIVAATPGLEGHQVLRYLGIASEHKMLDAHIVENEDSTEIPRHYQELAMKLKAHALKAHANAVVGLNYQLTPLPSDLGLSDHKYRLTCTGNLVWVNKL